MLLLLPHTELTSGRLNKIVGESRSYVYTIGTYWFKSLARLIQHDHRSYQLIASMEMGNS